MKKSILTMSALALAIGVFSSASAADKAAMNPDNDFVQKAAAGGTVEVELGQIASQKASNADVKSFADVMVKDHTKANDELKGIAQQKSITLPSEPMAKEQKVKDELQSLSGDKFDKRYANQMVSDHKNTVSLFEKEAKDGKDSDLKAFAAKTLPTLKAHLTMAKSLNDKRKSAKAGGM